MNGFNLFFSGLQMGFFLQKAERDYVIFERGSTAGKRTATQRTLYHILDADFHNTTFAYCRIVCRMQFADNLIWSDFHAVNLIYTPQFE